MAGHSVKVSVFADTTQFSKAFKGLANESGLSKLAGFGKQAAAVMVKAAAAAAGTAVAIGTKAIMMAGDLEQSAGAIEDVFKGSAGQMKDFAASANTSVGLTRNAYNELATVLGSQLKNAGIPMGELAGKTDGLIRQGADMAAMFGGTTADAVGALSSALKGERDPIERYGVSLKQAQIDAKAAAMGFTDVSSQQAQAAATLQLIADQTADASGKFGRESNTWSHQVQVIKAKVSDFVTALGEKLLPAATAVATWFAETGEPALERLANAIIARAGPAIDQLAGWFTNTLIPAARDVGTWLRDNLVPVLKDLGEIALEVGEKIAQFAGWLASNAGAILAFASPVLALVGAVMAYQKVMAVVKAAQTAWNAAMAAGRAIQTAYAFGTYGQVAADGTLATTTAGLAGALKTKAAAMGRGIAAAARTVAATTAQIASTVAHGVALAAQKVALGVSTAAQWAFNAAMSANPIALVVIAIAALVAGLVLFFTKTEVGRAVITAVWGAIKTAIGAVADWITGTAIPAILAAFEFLGSLPGKFAGWFGGAVDAAVRFLGSLVDWVKKLPGRIWDGLSSLASTVWNAITGAFGAMGRAATSAASDLWGFVSGIPGRILSSLGNVGRILWDAGASILQGFLDGLKSIWNNVTGFVGGIAGWIKDHKGPLSYDRTLLTPAGGAIMDGLIGGLAARMPALTSQLATITDQIAGTSADIIPGHISPADLARGRVPDGRPIIVVQALTPTPEVGRAVSDALDQWAGLNGTGR